MSKTRVRVDYELSEEFVAKVRLHQGILLSPLILTAVVDIVTELERKCVLSELLYADDVVLMSATIDVCRNKCVK